MNEFVPDGAPVREGHIEFGGSRTWYRVVGEAEAPGKLPVLCLHGGPGATWHHMEPYQQLVEGRRAVFYDQIGCGNSPVTMPHDPSMFTFDLFVRSTCRGWSCSVTPGAGCWPCCTRSSTRKDSRAW
jgi:pimeloyl-ACP methyl ester carboxylesterase